MQHLEPSAPQPPVRACLASGGTCIVRGERECKSLQAWRNGAFGELIIVDAATGERRERRASTPTVMLLRLRAVEAYYLAFGSQPPRLQLVLPPEQPHEESSFEASTSCSVEGESSNLAVSGFDSHTDEGPYNILPMLESASDAPPLDARDCWASLMEGEPRLPYLYAAYVALRGAGWFLRDGVKFGFDFALYDASAPPSKHAPLGAVVVAPHEQHQLDRTWLWLQRHSRVCHSVGKGLLLCNVEHPMPQDPAPSRSAGAGGAILSAGEASALLVSTVRIDGWDPDREHAMLSDPKTKKKGVPTKKTC